MSSVTVKLRAPVEWGKEKMVDELVLKPTASSFRDFSLPMTAEGKIDYQPYRLALVGIKMAGQAGGAGFLDKMSVADMNEVAQAVLGFMNPEPGTDGSAP